MEVTARSRLGRKVRTTALQSVMGVLILLVWHVGHLINPRAIPTLPMVVDAFLVQFYSGALVDAFVAALYAIAIGYALAIVFGIPIGFVMGRKPSLELFADPYVNAMYVLPVAGLIPAMILWFGAGLQIRIIVVFVFAVFPILINSMNGSKNVPDNFLKIAQSFGANNVYVLRNVVLPSSLPYIVVGLRLGAGLAVKGLVVTELLISVTGFGQLIHEWSTAFRMEGVFSVVIVLMLLGVVFTWIISQFESYLVHWEYSEGEA